MCGVLKKIILYYKKNNARNKDVTDCYTTKSAAVPGVTAQSISDNYESPISWFVATQVTQRSVP